jgi:hypothetical protein
MKESMYPLDFSRGTSSGGRVLVLLRHPGLRPSSRRPGGSMRFSSEWHTSMNSSTGLTPWRSMWRRTREAWLAKVSIHLRVGSRSMRETTRSSARPGGSAVLVGDLEGVVVLEEVVVAADVRHHQLLVGERVALEQVGHAGVVVDHHLVDA